jgi:hypothetical protein
MLGASPVGLEFIAPLSPNQWAAEALAGSGVR